MSTFMLLLLVAAVALAPIRAGADAGHDHGPAPAPALANTNAPQRLPDGSVYLPKLTQRQLALRTMVAEQGRSPQTFELFGKVMMDPNAGGKVQPTVAGRVEPGPRGLPSLGQAVRKGEVLAVCPPVGGRDRARESGGAGRRTARQQDARREAPRPPAAARGHGAAKGCRRGEGRGAGADRAPRRRRRQPVHHRSAGRARVRGRRRRPAWWPDRSSMHGKCCSRSSTRTVCWSKRSPTTRSSRRTLRRRAPASSPAYPFRSRSSARGAACASRRYPSCFASTPASSRCRR